MTFLGIDQSLSATGLCLLGRNANVIEMRTVDPGKLVGGQRLVAIKNELVAICRSVDWRVDFAALEGYSIGSINRPFDLGEVGGIIRMVLADNKIPYEVVAPVLVKKFATGMTSATKDKMIEAAEYLGATPANDNEADAYFLSRLARAYHSKVDMKRCEMETIHALKNPPSRAPGKKRPRKLIPNAI